MKSLIMLIDATYFKVRDGLHYENKALFVVAGIRDDGLQEILGTRLADNETLCPGKISSRTSKKEG
jgi:transposase-like protein